MKTGRKLVDIAEAKSFIAANWPNDPLLRQIGLNLLDKLPEVGASGLTNGDHFRMMDDAALADALIRAGDEDGPIDFCQRSPECLNQLDNGVLTDEMCRECAMQWLASPADKA